MGINEACVTAAVTVERKAKSTFILLNLVLRRFESYLSQKVIGVLVMGMYL